MSGRKGTGNNPIGLAIPARKLRRMRAQGKGPADQLPPAQIRLLNAWRFGRAAK